MKRIKMCDTAFIDSRCNEKTVSRFVLIFFDLSKMTRNGFTLHFILTLTRLHRDLYGQRKIVIVTDNVSHVAGCCRHRLTIIIEFQVGMDIAKILLYGKSIASSPIPLHSYTIDAQSSNLISRSCAFL